MPQNTRLSWEQKLQFVLAASVGEVPLAKLCRAWRLSRQTAYNWLKRYQTHGPAALQEQSRAPHHRPHALANRWLERIEQLRRRHPRWGPKKLRAVFHQHYPRSPLPACSTIGAALRRLGLILSGRRRRPGPVVRTSRALRALAPNDVWTVDFKGWFVTLDGQRCDPLTVRDRASRYGLLAQVLPDQKSGRVQQAFMQLFGRRGQPRALLMDNGSPFASSGPVGLSRLSAWFISLGIEVQFTRRAHPQDNGSHEQWHRELKAATTQPAAAHRTGQAIRTTRWLRNYNEQRPHEALGQDPPAKHYRLSRRPYRGSQPARYPRDWPVRRVRHSGEIKWQGRFRFVGEAFAHQTVGLRRYRRRVWRVYFYHVLLGELHDQDPGGLRVVRYRHRGRAPRKV